MALTLAAGPLSAAAAPTVYVVGRVLVRFDGWQGRRDSIKSGLLVQVTRRFIRAEKRRVRVYTAHTNAGGYFHLTGAPRRGDYRVTSVRHRVQGWQIAGRGGMAASVGRRLRRIIILGTYEYVIDKKGRVRSRSFLTDPKKFLQNFRRVRGLGRLIRRMKP
jgi:hypothetical protein